MAYIKLKDLLQENIDYKLEIKKALQKFPKFIQDDIAGEFFSDPNVKQEDFDHMMSVINSWEMADNNVKDIDVITIIKNPENKPVLDRLAKSMIAKINEKYRLNLTFSREGHSNLRSLHNLKKYTKLDPKTAPPITVDIKGRVLMGMHRTLAAIIRGDPTIKSYVMKSTK